MNEAKVLKADTLIFGRRLIEQQASMLQELAARLDAGFSQAVDLITSIPPEGRLVISGLGKAGLIASKVSATFASVGTPSFFLHPSEAGHGDLGRLATSDVFLLFSKSGQTGELLRILPYLAALKIKLISITSSRHSALGSASHIVIELGEIKEAGHLNLAPTSSAVAMLAVGDALACEAARVKGVSAEDFGRLHPGGALGKALLPVESIMRKGDLHCVLSQKTLCREVLHAITGTKGRPGAATIIDQSGRLAGIFTDGDLRRLLDKQIEFLDLPVEKFMTRNPSSVSPGVTALDALAIMSSKKIDQVIVIDADNKPIGLLDIQDVVAG